MANKTVKFDRKGVTTIIKGISKPIRNAKPYFQALTSMVDQDTQVSFDRQGARAGHPSWTPFRSKIGSPRPGTDGAKTRKWTAKSKLLQASGDYRRSFKKMRITKDGMIYGTNHELREKIGSSPRREVLFVTDRDIRKYQHQFKTFVDRGIVF